VAISAIMSQVNYDCKHYSSNHATPVSCNFAIILYICPHLSTFDDAAEQVLAEYVELQAV